MATTTTDEREEVVGTTPEALRDQALRSLKKRRDLKSHAFLYVLMNALIWGIWTVIGLTSHTWSPWPVFVTLGWGILLALSVWDVYGRKPVTEDELKHEIERLKASER